jgi:chlorophyllase
MGPIVTVIMRFTIPIALAFVVACPSPPPVAEGEGEVAEGEGDAAEGEGDVAEGEGDVAEGEGDVAEGEGDVAEGEGDAAEGEGDAAEGEGEPALFVSTGNGYEPGPLAVSSFIVQLDGVDEDIFVAAPTTAGLYAYVQFQHGFVLTAADYAGALEQLASHGFVVVAPQMYGLLNIPRSDAEAERATELLAELPGRLVGELEAGVSIDNNAVGLAGHSRGSKVIWTMLSNDNTLARGVFGLDPVDGATGFGDRRVIDGDFNFPIPTLVVGSGLGGSCTGFFCQPCAPLEDNHDAFYAASASPAYHVVATDLGHNDFIDDSCGAACRVCDSSEGLMPPVSNDDAPEFAGGLMAAFFRETLQGDVGALSLVLDPNNSPFAMTVEQR